MVISFENLIRSYLDKKISLHLNKNRKVAGTLRGYDQFMNIVLGDAVEEGSSGSNFIGMVVSSTCLAYLNLTNALFFMSLSLVQPFARRSLEETVLYR